MSKRASNSNSLKRLVDSLSASEKRYVTLFLKRNKSDSHLQKLFAALNKDDADQISGIPNYFVRANQLYDTILEGLKLYQSGQSSESLIRKYLADADLLFQRSLYKEASLKISKGMKLAEQFEKFTLQIDLLELDRKVRHRTETLDVPKGRLSKEYEKEKKIQQKLSHRITYRYLAYEAFMFSRREAVLREKQRRQEYDDFFNSEWFNDESRADSFQAKVDLYNSLGIYYRATADFQKLLEVRRKTMKLLDAHPEQVGELPGIFLSSLNNMIIACFHNKKFEEGYSYIKKLKEHDARNEDERLRIFVNASSLELGYFDYTRQFKKGEAVANAIEAKLVQVGERIGTHNRIALWFNLSLIYFRNRNFKKSARCLNHIINEKADQVRFEVLGFCRILQMMCFVELKDFERLESLTRSSLRFLDKKARLFKLEKSIISWFERAARSYSVEKADYSSLLTKLAELREGNLFKVNDDLVGIEMWLKEKIND